METGPPPTAGGRLSALPLGPGYVFCPHTALLIIFLFLLGPLALCVRVPTIVWVAEWFSTAGPADQALTCLALIGLAATCFWLTRARKDRAWAQRTRPALAAAFLLMLVARGILAARIRVAVGQ